jgi:p-aminobenzoyl-glutamate transporter AbgT
MSQDSPAPARRPSTGLWALIIVILLPAVVLPLWVPLYDKTDPTLFGFPFFFWFQFALILLSAVLTSIAYGLSLRTDRRGERSVR